jgi:hypothetical protein
MPTWPASNNTAHSAPGMDWVVIIHIAMLFFVLGFFACWAWILWRRCHHPKPHIKLLMELEEDLRREASISGKPDDEGKAREPWERDPDWWRRSGS